MKILTTPGATDLLLRIKICALWLIILVLTSCRGDEPKRMPDTIPDIMGTINSVTDTGEAKKVNTLQMLVKASEGVEPMLPEASVKVTENTLIEDEDGQRLKAGQLQQGQFVEVWFDGPVMESMPVQATAKAVRVTLKPKS